MEESFDESLLSKFQESSAANDSDDEEQQASSSSDSEQSNAVDLKSADIKLQQMRRVARKKRGDGHKLKVSNNDTATLFYCTLIDYCHWYQGLAIV
jgi:hypothetical protein